MTHPEKFNDSIDDLSIRKIKKRPRQNGGR